MENCNLKVPIHNAKYDWPNVYAIFIIRLNSKNTKTQLLVLIRLLNV